MSEIIASACITILITELIKLLIPENKAGRFISALITTLVIVNVITALFGSDLLVTLSDIDELKNDTYQLDIESLYVGNTKLQLEDDLAEFLESNHVSYNSISVIISKDKNGEMYDIELITVKLKYAADIERTKLLLKALLEDKIPVEVSCDGV